MSSGTNTGWFVTAAVRGHRNRSFSFLVFWFPRSTQVHGPELDSGRALAGHRGQKGGLSGFVWGTRCWNRSNAMKPERKAFPL